MRPLDWKRIGKETAWCLFALFVVGCAGIAFKEDLRLAGQQIAEAVK